MKSTYNEYVKCYNKESGETGYCLLAPAIGGKVPFKPIGKDKVEWAEKAALMML